MFKYLIIFLGLLTFASCSMTNNPSTNQTNATNNVPAPQMLYVDVREDDEWAAGHIEGALHVKLWDIETGNFSAIPKDTPVNLYCRSGRRSAIAYNILRNAGYTNITDAGGMESVRGVNIVR